MFLDPEGGFQKTTIVVVVVLVVGISSLKMPKAFLIRCGAQRKFAYTFVLIFPTDVPFQIFSRCNSINSVIKVHFMVSI